MTTFSPAQDWLIFDGLQTATYYSRINDSTFGSGISCQMLKRENNKSYKEGELTIELPAHHCIWELFISGQTAPFICKRADIFTAISISGNQTWIVEGVNYSTLLSRYRLHCSQYAFGS